MIRSFISKKRSFSTDSLSLIIDRHKCGIISIKASIVKYKKQNIASIKAVTKCREEQTKMALSALKVKHSQACIKNLICDTS